MQQSAFLLAFQFTVALFMFGVGPIIAIMFGAGIVWGLLAGVWLSATVIVLSGKRPYLFWALGGIIFLAWLFVLFPPSMQESKYRSQSFKQSPLLPKSTKSSDILSQNFVHDKALLQRKRLS
ncbi:hypothetical protein FD724_39225 (plasmid) [Nostoc sp. C057]|uniref:hypothetical protein n=1 Tax=Nostoc sp. C057 TaxID=2576903 RepID=UPI0015C3B7E3|nr:hypothetical protein [Nostoc sp. C057]QLE53858.1 hypothetical protein FD724_39225 [Nostoc sp. C057]